MGNTRPIAQHIAAFAAFYVLGFFPGLSFGDASVVLKADEQFAFAESYFNQGEYFRAIGEFQRFIYFFPQDQRVPAAMFKQGESYFKGQRFKQAIDTFEGLIDKYPSTDLAVRSYFMIADCHLQGGYPSAALLALDSLLRLTQDPDVSDEIHYRQGWIYMEMDQWDEAQASFGKISPKNHDKYRLQQLSEDLNKKKGLNIKNPRIAGTFAIIPGAGHVYCERYQDAFIAFLLNGAMIWATVEAFDNDNEGLGVLLALFEVGLYTGNIYSAVNCAHKYNRKQKEGFLQYLKDHSKVQLSAGPVDQGYAMALSYKIAF